MSYRSNRSNRSNRNDHADVYTDGACPNNGYDGARSGIGVYWGPGDSRNVSEPLSGRATNNRSEIQAATRAINQAADQNYKSMTINTDSGFLVDSATKWVNKWERNDWTLSNGGPVKNKADFQDLQKASSRIDVTYNKVDAHSGNPGNEAADRLAREGARR